MADDPPITLLGLERPGFSLPEFAARGISMTLALIEAAGTVDRDVNGNAVVLTAPQFRKVKATISCTDQESPGFAAMSSEGDMISIGDEFTVTCVPQLGSAEPVIYQMLVVQPGWQVTRDEYNVDTSWSLSLEEV